MKLEENVQYLKGVGTKKAALYEKLGITTLRDLLLYLPRRYEDLRGELTIDAFREKEQGAVHGEVVYKSRGIVVSGGRVLFKVKITDGLEDMTLTFFNTEYLVKSLVVGESYVFYGKNGYDDGGLTIKSPLVLPAEQMGYLYPVYSAVAGLSSKTIGKDIQNAITLLEEEFPTVVPWDLEQAEGLPSLLESVKSVHSPESEQELEKSITRLSVEELLPFSTALLLSRQENTVAIPTMKEVALAPFWHQLPFTPTDSQLGAVKDITSDLCHSGKLMNRLVLGDVGSGKTAVAAAAAYVVAKNGGQVAFMAPTEVLATQHYLGLKPLLEPLGITVALLTGSNTAKEKRLLKAALATGEIHLLIGTHALLTKDVVFPDLQLVITDEQHRFGVKQRAALLAQGAYIHTLVMSATPIPRTLSLLIYGDLEVSVMKTVPQGRLPIKTYLVDGGKRQRAYGFIKKYLDMGFQGYLVCTRVEDDELDDVPKPLRSAEALYKELSQGFFADYSVGLLHGKMKAKDKDKVMTDFRNGEIQLLIATSVIEVGVDVPNAVIMVMENAERFGLSQLHQLRGRVGRGKEQSYCVLISDSHNPDTYARLGCIVQNNDGFAIAQMDLDLRGPGDFFGKRQHGLPAFKMVEKLTDPTLPERIRTYSEQLLDKDVDLSGQEHTLLREQTLKLVTQLRNTIN